MSHTIKPLPKQLGQKYGNKFPAIQKAILALDAEQAARALHGGMALSINVDKERYEVEPGDVEVKAQAKGGFAVAEEGAYVAALVTALTPDLVQEGRAREVVRRVQDLRKSADLDVADRIRLYVEADPELRAAIEAYRTYVTTENSRFEFGVYVAARRLAVSE